MGDFAAKERNLGTTEGNSSLQSSQLIGRDLLAISFETRFCNIKSCLGLWQAINGTEHDRVISAEYRAIMHQCVREHLQPGNHFVDLAILCKQKPELLKQASGKFGIGGGQCMLDSFKWQLMLLVQVAGTTMQVDHKLGLVL